ncbi:hypothetical protein FACS1894195_4570 [Bacteroidia bacterium]|nr:hypothetical protein FACS1894195_4570 [Bacteroidia bacterium]
MDRNIITDSTKIDKKGRFTFKVKVSEPIFYAIIVGAERIPLLLETNQEEVQITGAIENLSTNYTVSGSEGSFLIKELDTRRRQYVRRMDSLKSVHNALLPDKQDDKEREALALEWNNVYDTLIEYTKTFILKYAIQPVSYYALYQKIDKDNFLLDPITENYAYRTVASGMNAMYPESQYAKAVLAHFKRLSADIRALKMKEMINNSENQLPEIRLPNVKGDSIRLSSLKGKFIVLDFTVLSAKDGESHIKDLQKMYDKFHSKGIEVYQVCLDQNRLLWEELVHRYKIKWHCVWDSDGAHSRAAQQWNIQSLPANYIISPKYDIAGKDLAGQRLTDRLNDLL